MTELLTTPRPATPYAPGTGENELPPDVPTIPPEPELPREDRTFFERTWHIIAPVGGVLGAAVGALLSFGG